MKLMGIEFHGFKSFADSAEIRFHDGMTAIVGPNGCGKSNISDALRWVLGEQRPSAIRGSRMEEAIFQGTERRKPIHRAEVTLRLSNEDRVLPVAYSEVEISRVVHRGGEGEYYLNGTACRLRDIQDLCRDTGLGTNAYAIIEGGMIDAILSDHAEERREMFEEAAGIGRYKERRRVAARRLDEADRDLARIDDLISEVQTKVRSLARQRGRARRYLEMRERKLALDLALARADLERLNTRRAEIDAELERLGDARISESTRLRSTESEHEAVRTRLSELERERSEGARRLMEVRDRLARLEQARLLAQQRADHARSGLDRIEAERRELSERRQRLSPEIAALASRVDERTGTLESVRDELQEKERALADVAERRQAMESAAAAVQSEHERYAERRAELEARRTTARAELRELDRRIDEVEARRSSVAASVEEAEGLREEAEAESERAEIRLREVSDRLTSERGRLEELERAREQARNRQAAMGERLHATRARIETLRPRTEGDEGLNPAVRAALERADELGIRGVLGRCVEVERGLIEGLEAYLGGLLEGLIVDDTAALARIREWFMTEYEGPGGIILLPLDRVSGGGGEEAALPRGVRSLEPGAPWVRYLLRDVQVGEGEAEAPGTWIGRRVSVDASGICRLGSPHQGAGLIAERAELERLRDRESDLRSSADVLAEEVRQLEAAAIEAATRVGECERERRAAEEEVARTAARLEAAELRLTRARDELNELGERAEELRGERERRVQKAEADERALRELRPGETPEPPDPDELASVRRDWEALRERVAALQVDEARAAAEQERVEQELSSARDALARIDERTARLKDESISLTDEVARAEQEAEEAADGLQAAFAERSRLEAESSELEERVNELRRTVDDLEATLRRIQQEEREHSESRHELELERSEIRAEIERIRERLQNEWGRNYEELAEDCEPAEGEIAELRAEREEVAEKLARIGPVNMLAEQEYQEESERLEFLEGQRADLVKARDDLRATIREINETASRELIGTLEKIRKNFRRTFSTLFQGGECDVWLEDPEDPLDSPIEISASPSGKRTQRIHLLSGGERALTALSLLFAIYLVKPSPFCVMDEVDAPLDETNIRRFVSMLEDFKPDVQFIVITHNPVTIEAADWIYGVTMEEPGVSKIVGVEFSEYARGAVA